MKFMRISRIEVCNKVIPKELVLDGKSVLIIGIEFHNLHIKRDAVCW